MILVQSGRNPKDINSCIIGLHDNVNLIQTKLLLSARSIQTFNPTTGTL